MTMRYRLRTLLIAVAILPPLLAAAWLVVSSLYSYSNEIYEVLTVPH